MKKQIFGKCDKCIGITPCRVLKDGTIVCEYCNDEVKALDIKHTPSEAKSSLSEQHV